MLYLVCSTDGTRWGSCFCRLREWSRIWSHCSWYAPLFASVSCCHRLMNIIFNNYFLLLLDKDLIINIFTLYNKVPTPILTLWVECKKLVQHSQPLLLFLDDKSSYQGIQLGQDWNQEADMDMGWGSGLSHHWDLCALSMLSMTDRLVGSILAWDTEINCPLLMFGLNILFCLQHLFVVLSRPERR